MAASIQMAYPQSNGKHLQRLADVFHLLSSAMVSLYVKIPLTTSTRRVYPLMTGLCSALQMIFHVRSYARTAHVRQENHKLHKRAIIIMKHMFPQRVTEMIVSSRNRYQGVLNIHALGS